MLPPMVSSQYIKQTWDTPPIEVIPGISKKDVAAMDASRDAPQWHGMMEMVLLRTVGRRSGREHKVALPIWRDPDDVRVVVASFAGSDQDPAWFLNLQDRAANPEVLCGTASGAYWSNAEVLDGEEYARIWQLLTEDRAWYQDYQDLTERRIPLVRLPESRPAE